MKKIILLLLSLVLVLGYANIALAVDEEPVKVEVEEVQEEIIEEDEAVVEEDACPHTWGEWFYNLTEHDDGSITYFRWCYCGAYEELDEQTFCDLGGQYVDCENGRHNWCVFEIKCCEDCGLSEEM